MIGERPSRWHLIKATLAMALPNVIFALLDQGAGLIDMWIAGKVGTGTIASIGLARQLMILIVIVTMAVTGGAAPLMGQAWGAKDKKQSVYVASNAMRIMVLLGIIFSFILYYLSTYIIKIMDPVPHIAEGSIQYLKVISLGLICLFMNFTLMTLFRAVGYVKVPVMLLFVMHGVNITTSLYLVVKGYGIIGIAWGTVLGRLAAWIVGYGIWLFYFKKIHITVKKIIDWSVIKNILTIGIPIGLMSLSRVGAMFIFFLYFVKSGELLLGAASLAFQVRIALIMPIVMIQQATVTLVSQSLGAENFDLAKRYCHATLWLALVLASIALIVIFLGGGQLAHLITGNLENNQELVESLNIMLRIVVIANILVSVVIVLNGALIGGGDVKVSFWYTILGEWAIMLPVSLWVRYMSGWPMEYLWTALIVSNGCLILMIGSRYRKEKWLRKIVKSS